MAVGLGINSPAVLWSPGLLAARTFARFGQANVVGLYLPEDIAWASNLANSQPGRVGAALAPAQQQYAKGAINGQVALNVPSSGYYHLFGNCTGAIKTLITVATTPAIPFDANYAQLLRTDTSAAIVGESNTSNLYSGGWTNYIDGAVTRDLTAGVHSYAATKADASSAILWHGHSSSTAWRGASGIKVALSIAASAQQILDYHSYELRPFYGF